MLIDRARGVSTFMLWFLLSACVAVSAILPPPPRHPDGRKLWEIVNGRCIPGQLAAANPAPCTEVSITMGVERGHALLKDRLGAGQFLLMPTILISGIEDPRLLRRDSPDYFTSAWRAGRLVAARFGKSLAREDISVAINSRYGRTQDLLHLHVDCLRLDVRDELKRTLSLIGRRWSRGPVLAGHRYYVVRVDGEDEVATNPFQLLSRGLHVKPSDMGAWTLVLVGAHFAGRPAFILLAARADPASGYDGSGEQLQDHNCEGR